MSKEMPTIKTKLTDFTFVGIHKNYIH